MSDHIEIDPNEFSRISIIENAEQGRTKSVANCLPGFLNSPEPQIVKGECQNLMPQLCYKNWQGYCNVYLESLPSIEERIDFLENAVKQKYCDFPNKNYCSNHKNIMDPLDPASVLLNKYDGIATFIDTSSDPKFIQPTKINICQPTAKDCRPLDLNDPLVKKCIANGGCKNLFNKGMLIESYTPSINFAKKDFMQILLYVLILLLVLYIAYHGVKYFQKKKFSPSKYY